MLAQTRRDRFHEAVAAADFDAFLAASPANVGYTTGYRSVAGQLFRQHQMAAVVTDTSLRLVLPVADSAPAIDGGVSEDEIVAYGRFYFASANGTALPARLADQHPDFASAALTAIEGLGLTRGRIGVDVAGLGAAWSPLRDALPETVEVVEATGWASEVRAPKNAEEIELLRRAARIAETGIDRAIASAAVGKTERDLATVVASTMVEAGAEPGFIVVTSGPRSALADAFPTDRQLVPGDIVRFDVGCVLSGYWSDIGRTAVVGEPDDRQRAIYDALFAGEEKQFAAVRPGITARELFEVAVGEVEAHGITPYRRQHCGHGIGTDVYEPPIVAPGVDTPLRPGMTFCLETPYYELGWGGMMVEDLIVVTESGCEVLTESDRSLRTIPA